MTGNDAEGGNGAGAGIGVLSAEAMAALSGLEFLRGAMAGTYPLPPITETMPMRLVAVEEGRVVFEARPEARHLNPIGTIHGGFAATVLDGAMACAVHSHLPAGTAYTTLEIKISYLRGLAPDSGPLTAEARTLSVGRRAGTAEAHLRDGAGRLIAHGTSTCLIFPAG